MKLSVKDTVLFEVPIRDTFLLPTPYKDSEKWHKNNYARLPYMTNHDNNDRWSSIETSVTQDIRTSFDLEEAIFSYNRTYSKSWKFVGLNCSKL